MLMYKTWNLSVTIRVKLDQIQRLEAEVCELTTDFTNNIMSVSFQRTFLQQFILHSKWDNHFQSYLL